MKRQEIYSNCLAYQLAQARKLVFAFYQGFLEPLGLTPLSVYALGVLQDQGAVSPSEIATLLNLERPTVTPLLARMERDGFIHRETHPTNRRQTVVTLTNKGRTACETAYSLLLEADRVLDQRLEGDLLSLKTGLRELNNRMGGLE